MFRTNHSWVRARNLRQLLTLGSPISAKRPSRSVPQTCLKPRNSKVSGLPSTRAHRSAANRPKSSSRVFSSASSRRQLRARLLKVFCVRQILETEHEVIDEAHQVRRALALWFELLLEPQVQGVVQIDVGEHTGDRSALRSSLLGTNNDPILHRSGLEPLTNQAQDHRISDALPDHPL